MWQGLLGCMQAISMRSNQQREDLGGSMHIDSPRWLATSHANPGEHPVYQAAHTAISHAIDRPAGYAAETS